MANDNTLNVEITSSVDGLKKGLVQADKGLKQFDTAAKKVTKTTGKMGKTVVKGAVPAMTSFSQVVQDAPFGIRGVANNIQQLTMQMGHLSANAGGTKNALKAMVSTLSGPAGILLAVSLVTSLLVSYGGEIKKFISGNEDAAAAQEALNKKLDDYKESLTGVAKSQLKGSESAAKELTNLKLLKAQVDNTNLSNEDRIKAIDELQRKYPNYLGNISDEDALVGGLDDQYDKLTTAILKSAKAKAAASLITEKAKKQLILQAQLEENSIKISESRRKLDVRSALALKQSQTARGTGSKENILLTEQYNNEVKDGLEKQAGFVKEINRLQKETLKLSQNITDEGGIVPLDVKGGGVDKFKGDIVKSLNTFKAEVVPLAKSIGDEMANAIVPIAQMEALIPTMDTQFLRMRETLNQFNQDASDIINSNIANTFADLGYVIGEALATGGNVLEAAGGVLLGGLGSVLIQLGEMAIATGIGIKAIKTALESLNPFVAIAAGIALVALGSAVSSKAKSISSSSGGGGGASSGGGNSSFRGGSTSGFSGGSGAGGTYVFEIAGTKLVGVLKNTLDRNRALGGSLGFTS